MFQFNDPQPGKRIKDDNVSYQYMYTTKDNCFSLLNILRSMLRAITNGDTV